MKRFFLGEKRSGAHDRGHAKTYCRAYSMVGRKTLTRGRRDCPKVSNHYLNPFLKQMQMRRSLNREEHCEDFVFEFNFLILQELYK
jgi:hypothetical protein